MKNNWRDVTVGELKTELAFLVETNDPVAAKNLINYYQKRFADIGLDGCPNGAIGILCEYIEHVFNKMIVENYTPEQALGLKRPRGKYHRPDTFERDCAITAYMVLLMRQGYKWLDAKGEAANRYFEDGKGDKAVETAYEKYKSLFQVGNFSDSDLKAIADGSLRS